MTPVWVAAAKRYDGMREIPGAPTEPRIAAMLKRLKAWWADDETPWCGTFVAAVMLDCSIPPAKAWYRAKDWLNWGQRIDYPAVGAIVVFNRSGGGHVAIVVGQDNDGRLLCIGGNQGNKVGVDPFDRARLLGYRWPPGERMPVIATLPVFASSAKASSNEA